MASYKSKMCLHSKGNCQSNEASAHRKRKSLSSIPGRGLVSSTYRELKTNKQIRKTRYQLETY